jgi:uncharacterized protein YneF (UPF0154 family)
MKRMPVIIAAFVFIGLFIYIKMSASIVKKDPKPPIKEEIVVEEIEYVEDPE